MKKGDVFRWAYKPEHLPASGCDPYWCCAQLAIFDGSSLRDIYWTGYDGRTWSMAEYHRNRIAQLQDVPLPAEEGDE